MTGTVSVTWHVAPISPPKPHRHCSSCRLPRPFQSSGRVRLNANGQRLDAWLVYKCMICGDTWNLPLLDRVRVADVATDDLHAMQTNDADWVRARAFDLVLLRRHAAQVALPTDVVLTASAPLGGGTDWTLLWLKIVAPLPTGLRLDRLLAGQLGLSRSAVQSMQAAGGIQRLDGGPLALTALVAGNIGLRFVSAPLTHSARRTLSQAFGLAQTDLRA